MKLSIPLFTGFATYLLLTVIFGDYGLANYSEMERYRDRLESHLELLKSRKDSLDREEQLLRESGDRLRVEARSLGYLEPEERLLRIEGAPRKERRKWAAGRVVRPVEELPDHSGSIRAISICVALLTLILLLARGPSARRRLREEIKEEQANKKREQAYSIRRASM